MTTDNLSLPSVLSPFLIGLEKMTEKESAHPTSQQLHDLTSTTANGELVGPLSPQVTSSPSSSPQDCPPLPMGTSIQPPAHANTLPPIQDLKLSDKVRRHVGWDVNEWQLLLLDWKFFRDWWVNEE